MQVKGYLVKGGSKTEDLKITGNWDDQINVQWQGGTETNLGTFKYTGPPTKNK